MLAWDFWLKTRVSTQSKWATETQLPDSPIQTWLDTAPILMK